MTDHQHDDTRGDTISHSHDDPAGHRHAGKVTAMDLETGAVEEYAVEYGPAYPADNRLKPGTRPADGVP